MVPSLSREYWIATAARLARPVLSNLANRTLRQNMPVEQKPGAGRESFSHLEALGRLLAGLAPWLESGEDSSLEWAELARQSLDAATDPSSPDFCNFHEPGQPLVDAAFLAHALLRAPHALWKPLADDVKGHVIHALKQTRRTKPPSCNWLLFSAMIEIALCRMGEADWDAMRVDYALRQHEQWYLGDGVYGDGPHYRADYYNAFVIHPMLVDIVRHLPEGQGWGEFSGPVWGRALRYAAEQERMISPEGTFPPAGRSLGYRFGTLQGLAQMALFQRLPEGVRPAQVRCAMTAVIRRMVEAPGTFDENGWLRIGFCGAQPGIGEGYISTGSLYHCATGLLPLGLPESAPFWSDPCAKWTAQLAWSGGEFPIDHADD
ncbi:MAG: DUF2264 domain-containing protein [Terrimicrobiaceae bacterium]